MWTSSQSCLSLAQHPSKLNNLRFLDKLSGQAAKGVSHSRNTHYSGTTCDVCSCGSAAKALSYSLHTPHNRTTCGVCLCGQAAKALSHSLNTSHSSTTWYVCTCGPAANALTHSLNTPTVAQPVMSTHVKKHPQLSLTRSTPLQLHNL